MITTTTGGYNIQPWSSLQLDAIPTMMEYNTVIIGPGSFNYSVSYGYEVNPSPAICEYDEDITYTNWGVSNNQLEPINSDTMTCASVCFGSTCTDSSWKTADCSTPMQYLCQIDFECGEDWITFDNSCYKYEAGQNLAVTSSDGFSYCAQTYPDSYLMVPNSRDEAAFIGSYLTSLKNTALGASVTSFTGLVGGLQSSKTRYLDYVDGSIMTDGNFYDVAAQAFGGVYQNGVAYYCLMINSMGNIQQCSISNVLCEKTLLRDVRMCLNKASLATSILINQTTLVNLASYATASSCIEYCRGTIGNQYAVISDSKCTCGSKLLVDVNQPVSVTGDLLPASKCSFSTSNAMIGSSSAVAVYDTNHSVMYNGSKKAPTTCRAYAHELYITRNGIETVSLQNAIGNPIIRANCSYSDRRLCLYPLLQDLTSSQFLAIGTTTADFTYLSSKTGRVTASLSNCANGGVAQYANGYGFYECESNNQLARSNYDSSSKSYNNLINFQSNVKVQITLPKVSLINAIWWSSYTLTDKIGYIVDIEKMYIKGTAIMGGSDYTSTILYDPNRSFDSGSTDLPVRFLTPPAYTDVLTFGSFSYKVNPTNPAYTSDTKPFWFRVHSVQFEMELFGCDNYQIDEVYCLSGWTSKRGNCLKAFEWTSNLNYSKAADNCQALGGQLAQPTNAQETDALSELLSNLTNITATSFWIGIEFNDITSRNILEWHFLGGLGILTLHYSNWAASNPDPLGQTGQCVKVSLVQNVAVWMVTNCMDVTGKGYVCQKRQNFDEIGCYVMPSMEVNSTVSNRSFVTIPTTSKFDPASYCRDRCIGLSNQYFVLLESYTKCQCIPQVPLGGLVPPEECIKPVCTTTQDPVMNSCHLEDGYTRTMLYRTWNTSCTPLTFDYNTTFTYVWRYHGAWHWGSTVELRCMPGYQIPANKVSDPRFNATMNTQSLVCLYDPDTGGYWSQRIVPCEPLNCRFPPPATPTGAFRQVLYSPNQTTNQQYQTTVAYFCPANLTLPTIIKSNFSFAYTQSFGIVQNVSAVCKVDGSWEILYGPLKGSCPTNTDTLEKCDQPVIPSCIDRNKYCTLPPAKPTGAQYDELSRPLQDWINVPGTKLKYNCPLKNWAFDYPYDKNLPSFYFTPNVNNMTIYCNTKGFWEVDYPVVGIGGTCQSMQADGSCTSIFIPPCVDRTVYCEPLTPPGNSTKSIVSQPNPLNQVELGTSVKFTCPLANFYFDYSVPSNLSSFFYSTNINSTTLTCNNYRTWSVLNGINGETCTDYKAGDDELWCTFVRIPKCVDRTISCSEPPTPEGAVINYSYRPNSLSNSDFKTSIEYSCSSRRNYFDYPVGNNFVSFYYTTNINSINVTCNKDGLWNVTGGKYGLTCDTPASVKPDFNDTLECRTLNIPPCVDRTVYCTYPPEQYPSGEIKVPTNPSLTYKVPSAPCRWTAWMNVESGGTADRETLAGLMGKYGAQACPKPSQIIARRFDNKEIANKSVQGRASSPQIFTNYDTTVGFQCQKIMQPDEKDCFDYEVKLCCPPSPENGTVVTLECTTPNWYLDFTDAAFLTKMEIQCTNNGTWSTEIDISSFCADGSKSCVNAKLATCQDRTIQCLGALPSFPGMIKKDITDNSTLNSRSLGAKFAYSCTTNGFVVAAPGYPEEVVVECVPPEGYPDTWSYEIWLKGQWANLGNISKCIDPNLCYNDPPALPADFSVEWNQTAAKPNTVNTTLNYTCGRKYWVFKFPDLYSGCSQSADECAAAGASILHTFNNFVDGTNQISVTCKPGKRSDGLPDWVWSAEDFEFSGSIPSCYDPTYCESDPPVPELNNADYKNPPFSTLKYKDGEVVTYTCQNSVYRFPNFSLPKTEWSSTLDVRCGYGKQWEPLTVLGCIDPRGCQAPPPRNSILYGSYEDSVTKPLDVGSAYWYSCRAGLFRMETGTVTSFIEVTCVNDPEGGPPFWNPPYDHEINPFPLCEMMPTEPPTTTTPGLITTYAPPDLLYRKTANYYWPNFNNNVTSLTDPTLNVGNWNSKTGVQNGPIGFGTDVQLSSSQCLVHTPWVKDNDECAKNPLNCPDGMTFAMWEKNPFFDVSSLVLYGQDFGKKCLACNGAYADVKTAMSCPGFCLWREGVDLCALVSTGESAWKVCVTGQIYLSSWANIGIRWIKTNRDLPNAQLGGLELYMNGVMIGSSMLELQPTKEGASNFVQDPKCSVPGPVSLGCCWNTTLGKYESFSGGEYDELAFWTRRLIKNGSMNELPFLTGGYSANFSSVSADAFNTMMANVDTKNENQALLAQQVLQAMILGPPTTTPAIPTRTANPFAVAGPKGVTTVSTTTTSKSMIDQSSSTIAINQLSLQAAVASMLNTGTYGVDSKTPDEVTNRFALAIVAAKLLSGDKNNVIKWEAVDETFPQETGAPKTLQQLTDYMLDYVGSVNISAESSKSAYYNKKNKTMHFYTSGDDFVMYGDKLMPSQFREPVRRLEFPNYGGPEWFIPKQKWDNPKDTFSIPTGMYKDQPNCIDKPMTIVSSILNGYGKAAPKRRNPALVLQSEWDIDSKVINVEVKVNPDVFTYDMEEVANCTVNLDYMESNKIKVRLYHKMPSLARIVSRSLLWHSNMERLGVEVRQCVWWNPDFGTNGAWDPAYCDLIETSPEVTDCECKRFGSIAVLREMSEKFEVKPACDIGMIIKYIGMVVSIFLLLFFVVVTFTQTKVYDMFHNLRMHASLTWIAALIAHVLTDVESIRSNTHANLAVGFVMIYFYISSSTWVACEAHATFRAFTNGIISGRNTVYIPFGYGTPLALLGALLLFFNDELGTDPRCFVSWDDLTKSMFFYYMFLVTSIGVIFSIIILFNMAKPQTKRKNVIADLTTQAKGTVIICFVKLMLWIFAYFTYIRNPESDTPDLYCTFIFVLGWIGVAFFFFYAFFSRRFRSVVRKNKAKKYAVKSAKSRRGKSAKSTMVDTPATGLSPISTRPGSAISTVVPENPEEEAQLEDLEPGENRDQDLEPGENLIEEEPDVTLEPLEPDIADITDE